MDLSERKRKILQAVIDEYIGTAEPVGSRAISKNGDLKLSSATIRNEMADLEDMGYLIQPHTSAGRIPSDEGYRFYVNSLMRQYQMGMEAIMELQKAFQMHLNRLDQIIKYAGRVASALTDYTTIITSPERSISKIRKIDVVPMSQNKTMLIVVTEVVSSQVMSIALDTDDCEELASALNARLRGKSAYDVTLDDIVSAVRSVSGLNGVSDDMRYALARFVYDAVTAGETDVYVENVKSILKYPEYHDVEKAGEMVSFLEDKDKIRRLINDDSSEGINAKIGDDNKEDILKDCSLVTVNYSVGDRRGGKIGIIGPKRMNYAKVFSSLDIISSEIDKILRYYTEE